MKLNVKLNDFLFIKNYNPENKTTYLQFPSFLKKSPGIKRLIPLDIKNFGYFLAFYLIKNDYNSIYKLCKYLKITPENFGDFDKIDDFYFYTCYTYLICYNESFSYYPSLKSSFVNRYDCPRSNFSSSFSDF